MNSSTSLSSRMGKLKEISNQSPRSVTRDASPLSLFLAIYSKASHDCYIDYMQGAKDLHAWLTLQGTVPLDCISALPEFELPRHLITYELNELTKIVAPRNNLENAAIVRRAIFTTFCKDLF